MRRLRILIIGLALLLARAAAAQDSTATAHPPVSASQMAVARELMDAMHMTDAGMVGMQVSLDQEVRANPALAPFRSLIQQWAAELFASEEAKNAFATVYAENFTEDELRQLVAFYHTPLGQKVASRLAVLGKQGAEVGRSLALAHQAELQQRIQAQLVPPVAPPP